MMFSLYSQCIALWLDLHKDSTTTSTAICRDWDPTIRKSQSTSSSAISV